MMEEFRVDFLAQFIYESDAIAGIKNDCDVLKCKIKNGENNGHVGAMLWLESLVSERSNVLKTTDIFDIQKLITENQYTGTNRYEFPEKYFRFCGNTGAPISNKRGVCVSRTIPLMNLLTYEMACWCSAYKQYFFEKNIVKVSDFHSVFKCIRPFVNGNGRTGRAIVYYLLRYAGIEPFIFTNVDKDETYCKCFDRRQDMRKYFLVRAKDQNLRSLEAV